VSYSPASEHHPLRQGLVEATLTLVSAFAPERPQHQTKQQTPTRKTNRLSSSKLHAAKEGDPIKTCKISSISSLAYRNGWEKHVHHIRIFDDPPADETPLQRKGVPAYKDRIEDSIASIVLK
jgi:hypothetical protein